MSMSGLNTGVNGVSSSISPGTYSFAHVTIDSSGRISSLTSNTNVVRKYSGTFTGVLTQTITAATHGLGSIQSLFVNVYAVVAGVATLQASAAVTINASGDVTWTVLSGITGFVVIMG